MTPKPHGKSTSGWLGRRTTRLKSLVVVGTVTLGMAGLGIAAAGPAAADPATQYVLNGSDTVQDVDDAFAAAVNLGVLGSWDAVNPVTASPHETITPVKALAGGTFSSCSYTRPNGSTEGFNALVKSVFPATTRPQLAVPPQPGCVDISRSSSIPGSISNTAGTPGSLDPTGNLIYIPFAMDGMTGATGPTTAGQSTTTKCVAATPGCMNVDPVTGFGTITFTVPTTNIAQADAFTLANLTSLYNCNTVTVNGVTYNPVNAGAGQQQIDLYLPQNGSGTLKFWVAALGLPSPLPTCLKQTIAAGPANGVLVEEHDGAAVASDPNGYGPFSIAQWVAQSNGHNDRRHTAILHNIDGIAPLVNGTMNPNIDTQLKREVYNVMQYDHAVDNVTAGGPFDSQLNGLFVSGTLSGGTTTSSLCAHVFTIKSFGFLTLPQPGLPDTCGAFGNQLRVQETNTGPS